jgi:small multidrug resistance pump
VTWALLGAAIVSEVIGTLSLRASDGFSRPLPSLVVVVCYGAAFYFLAKVLQAGFSVGLAYAIWAAVGVALVAVFGWIVFGESLTPLAILGIGFVIVGVVLIETGGGAR